MAATSSSSLGELLFCVCFSLLDQHFELLRGPELHYCCHGSIVYKVRDRRSFLPTVVTV